ncbi:hypothetical protein MVEN_02590400 [Mycena venus]|uniref:polynucleotide adenylyltransferase n=1 Tax=Mycena venus TaxID=2733690 RepID=A0A8H6U1T3_9AGAR|nr:hypothetical protein MVEN_02590400 [Mycena venus]
MEQRRPVTVRSDRLLYLKHCLADISTAGMASMAYSQPTDSPEHTPQRRLPSRHRFFADLSQCLFDFVIELLPTGEEMAVKENVRKLLERLIRTIEPESRLLSFGSTANGFSLRNSDMDLCCLIDSEERLSATDLVTMLGDLLERETKFHVKPLPHARIPIVKLSLDPSPGLPLGIACDIGFENRLALENTRLLMCYAMIDPTRVRTLVLFLKVWSKRRKINSPYKGTLSSYGYVLLVIYFLVHVKNPPVLPNLQQMPPLRPITKEDTHLAGYNTWFFDDIELLRTRWHSENNESVAELQVILLLIDFFRYYARDFSYNTGVASIRAGLLKKTAKGWQNDLSSRYHDSRERNRLCIEDPFELDFNVGRCVTKDGIYTIRGEFMRASRILSNRPERAVVALAELCAERPDEDLVSPPSSSYNVLRPPPQTPYSIGSGSGRTKAPAAPTISAPISVTPSAAPTTLPAPPPSAHMAPRRSKWTSPPPPDAPEDARALFESNLGHGLELATSSTEAREREQRARESAEQSASEGTSEVFTDTDASVSDAGSDVVSVRSFTEGVAVREGEPTLGHGNGWRRPSWHAHNSVRPPIVHQHLAVDAAYYGTSGRLNAGARGAKSARSRASSCCFWPAHGLDERLEWAIIASIVVRSATHSRMGPNPVHHHNADSYSSPAPPVSRVITSLTSFSLWTAFLPFPFRFTTHCILSNVSAALPALQPAAECIPRLWILTVVPRGNIIGLGVPPDVFPSNHPPLSMPLASSFSSSATSREHTPVPKLNNNNHHTSSPGPPAPNPPSPSWMRIVSQHTQTHSRSNSTNAPTPKPHAAPVFSQQQTMHVLNSRSPLQSDSPSAPRPLHPPSSSPPLPPAPNISKDHLLPPRLHDEEDNERDRSSSAASSPTPSLSTGYETSISMSPSPSPPLQSGDTVPAPKSPTQVTYDDETPRGPGPEPVLTLKSNS